MKIFSIFNSIDGEVNFFHAGHFSTFIRFSGCAFAGVKVHCSYCDTKYSQSIDSGTEMTVDEVMSKVKEIGCKKITITGGEPMFQQEELVKLLKELKHQGYRVSLETNGSYPISNVLAVDSIIMDWKLSNAGIVNEYMFVNNFKYLSYVDFIKFVIDNEESYNEALGVIAKLKERCHARYAFSPMYGKVEPKQLIEWCQRDKVFDVIINLQLHKFIWPVIKEGEEH